MRNSAEGKLNDDDMDINMVNKSETGHKKRVIRSCPGIDIHHKSMIINSSIKVASIFRDLLRRG